MNVNDVVQPGGVLLAVVLCIGWVIRRIVMSSRARKNGANKCSGCELSEMCNKHKCDK